MMRESPHLDPETYWKYIEALKTQKNVPLSTFGFSTLVSASNKKGKVESFRAVIPSTNEKELLRSLTFEHSSPNNAIDSQKPQNITRVRLETKGSLNGSSENEPIVKYRYDFHGFRVRDDGNQLEPVRKRIPPEPPSLLTVGVGKTFEGRIVQKTKSAIELRLKESEKKVGITTCI